MVVQQLVVACTTVAVLAVVSLAVRWRRGPSDPRRRQKIWIGCSALIVAASLLQLAANPGTGAEIWAAGGAVVLVASLAGYRRTRA